MVGGSIDPNAYTDAPEVRRLPTVVKEIEVFPEKKHRASDEDPFFDDVEAEFLGGAGDVDAVLDDLREVERMDDHLF